jgi:hypothetical protein
VPIIEDRHHGRSVEADAVQRAGKRPPVENRILGSQHELFGELTSAALVSASMRL